MSNFCAEGRRIVHCSLLPSAFARKRHSDKQSVNRPSVGVDCSYSKEWIFLTNALDNTKHHRVGSTCDVLAFYFNSCVNGGRNHRQYSLRLPTEGWPGWVGLSGWLRSEIVYLLKAVTHPSTCRYLVMRGAIIVGILWNVAALCHRR